jgi:hypothetical protein
MHADSLAGGSLAGGSLARKTEKVTKRTPSTVNRPMQATTPRQKKNAVNIQRRWTMQTFFMVDVKHLNKVLTVLEEACLWMQYDSDFTAE